MHRRPNLFTVPPQGCDKWPEPLNSGFMHIHDNSESLNNEKQISLQLLIITAE